MLKPGALVGAVPLDSRDRMPPERIACSACNRSCRIRTRRRGAADRAPLVGAAPAYSRDCRPPPAARPRAAVRPPRPGERHPGEYRGGAVTEREATPAHKHTFGAARNPPVPAPAACRLYCAPIYETPNPDRRSMTAAYGLVLPRWVLCDAAKHRLRVARPSLHDHGVRFTVAPQDVT